jgi:carboxymethylenebutenolidase
LIVWSLVQNDVNWTFIHSGSQILSGLCHFNKSKESKHLYSAVMSSNYVESMAKEHANDAPIETPASKIQPKIPIDEKDISFGSKPFSAYLATPKDCIPSPPCVLVIHEWWGLNDQIKSVTRQLAREGYIAVAVDLYLGHSASNPAEARNLMQAALTDKEGLVNHMEEAVAYMRETYPNSKLGVVGWCFGGMFSLQVSLACPLDATVIYYGNLVSTAEEVQPLSSPVLGLFGELDTGIKVEYVRQFESALKEAGKEHEIHVYPGANHAFANPSGMYYKEDAAQDAWSKTLAFFQKHLE